jgi:PIN domain nuclease of toxin-antitoxin system
MHAPLVSQRPPAEEGHLPAHHADPFDRMLIAEASLEELVLGVLDLMRRWHGG